LRRGFIQAGAQNLLITLWPISDELTVQIMSDFYEAAHDQPAVRAAMVSGGPTQVHMSVARAAGCPPMRTLGQPGGKIGPPTCGTVETLPKL
jgi:hypothetical protein